jgi:AraC-like DNA-binding protein
VPQLCLLFATNKTTLSGLIKHQTGKSIVGYVNDLKLAEAKKLIRIGGKTFTQIAEELNFSSVHYFTRLFHKMEKQTPSQYARSVKAKLSLEDALRKT